MQEHPAYADLLNHYLSFATIIGAVCVIVFFGALIYLSYKKDLEKYSKYLGNYIFPIGFCITLGGSFLTLFYQYILNYEPCDLCWYQRVFLYPQVLMFAYAWYKKDRAVLPYALVLSVAGFAVALYHHALQLGFDLMKPCSSAPFAVDCAKPSFIEFGFVTFPFMAVVLFGFLALLYATAVQSKK